MKGYGISKAKTTLLALVLFHCLVPGRIQGIKNWRQKNQLGKNWKRGSDIKYIMVQWQTLDTTTADIWIPMQVISNVKRKVWVFPRKNPLQIARHGGPPPMTMIIPTDNADRFDEINSTSIDSWAGMKSPQKWGPSLLHYPVAAMHVFPMPGMIMIPAMADSSTPFFFHRNKRYPSPHHDFHNSFQLPKCNSRKAKAVQSIESFLQDKDFEQ